MQTKLPLKKRSITPIGLLLTSISAIIGSGWLFSAFYSAKLAGPAALISWIIGAAAAICIAFVFAELCAMLPITGSSTRIPRFTHGNLVSFLFSWIIWLSYISFAPTETQAVIQYLRFYFPSITYHSGALTSNGYICASVIMVVINIINFYSVRWLIRVNSFLTILKIIVPTTISLLLITVYLAHHDATTLATHAAIAINAANTGASVGANSSNFMPFGLKGVFYALVVGGIVFSFNGFKQAAEMAGEAENPGFALPFAIVGSVVVCLFVFLLLQTSFLSGLKPENLIHGWKQLSLVGGTSPFVSLLYQNNMLWAVPILYFGAIVAPLAAALMYIGSAARSLYGISKSGQLPFFLQTRNAHGNPVYAIGLNFVLGMLMFAPLPGWDQMVAFLTSLLAITYSIGPISLLALRHQLPQQHRPFRLPFVKIWATVAFYISTLLVYWNGWLIISKMGVALASGIIALVAYRLFSKNARKLNLDWHAATWLWPYLIGLTGLSYLGSFGGGRGIMPFGWDCLVIAIFSLVIMMLAMKFKLPSIKTEEHVAKAING